MVAMDWMLSSALGLQRRPAAQGLSAYRVFVRNLVVPFRIGVYEHEKTEAQRVRVNVDLSILPPPATDDLGHVLNYEEIVEGVRALADRGHILLVERLAEDILDLCFSDPRVVAGRVSVEKLDVYPDAESVGVTLRRRRKSGLFPV